MKTGKALITGATSGIGLHLAGLLAAQGWELVLVNRSRARSQRVLDWVAKHNPQSRPDVIEADLADHESLRRAVAEVQQRHPRIDVLFNNAGVLLGELAYSSQGNEMHFEVNTLAPYQLMRLLQPQLAAAGGGAVLVNVSTGAIKATPPLRVDELRRPPRMVKVFGPYAQSKLATLIATQALAPGYAESGILLRNVDPGPVKTPMTAGRGMTLKLLWQRLRSFKPPAYGAQVLYDGALDPAWDGRPGLLIDRGRQMTPHPASADPAMQASVLSLCRELTGV
jgi:NAD(P)-dependent dehydrogenase (short-subunit alcohol dehydrogenase family)